MNNSEYELLKSISQSIRKTAIDKKIVIMSTPQSNRNVFFDKWTELSERDDHTIVQEKLDALENFEE